MKKFSLINVKDYLSRDEMRKVSGGSGSNCFVGSSCSTGCYARAITGGHKCSTCCLA